jgi:hypothetical protein
LAHFSEEPRLIFSSTFISNIRSKLSIGFR